VSGGRLKHALAAFLRQEFGAPVTAITGFLDIMIEDAGEADLADFVPDLERMRKAAAQLSRLIAQAVDHSPGVERDSAQFRHELRTPLNAIKGYGELLIDEVRDSGRKTLLADLTKVVDLANRLLAEIDRWAETAAARPVDAVDQVLRAIKPLDEGDIRGRGLEPSRILVVDDTASNLDLLSRRLLREGYRAVTAESGAAALALMRAEAFDLVLLDLMMPGMSGFEVLCHLKAEETTRHIPVIMISALDELDSTVRCIEAGAEDYLSKPFNPVLLRARIGASLEKKRLVDELRSEQQRSEALLLNILPRPIVERMRLGETAIADHIAEATVLFSDLVDFTSLSTRLAPEETVRLLALLFSEFDDLATRYGLETIKTIGDGYLVTGGILEQRPDKAASVAEMALSMLESVEHVGRAINENLQLRIGMHTGGPIVAGVLGTHKIGFDIWGDTVNIAKRMETHGWPGRVHVSAATRQVLGDAFHFEPRGPLKVKGKGLMETYFLYRQSSE
jgi:class 3 adenylate cyclase